VCVYVYIYIYIYIKEVLSSTKWIETYT